MKYIVLIIVLYSCMSYGWDNMRNTPACREIKKQYRSDSVGPLKQSSDKIGNLMLRALIHQCFTRSKACKETGFKLALAYKKNYEDWNFIRYEIVHSDCFISYEVHPHSCRKKSYKEVKLTREETIEYTSLLYKFDRDCLGKKI